MSQDNFPADALAQKTWQTLQHHSLKATPENYTLLYTYFSRRNPEVTDRLAHYFSASLPLNSDLLAAVYEDCFTKDAEADALSNGADEISQVAERLLDWVADSHVPREAYGRALEHWASQLDERATVPDLLQAVTALSLETRLASERNRALEQKLSTSTLRIAKLRQNLTALRESSTTCPLAGIPNRKGFEIKLRRALTQAKADPSSRLCLLMLDVDHFKRFNDTYGHRTGDQVLRLVARMLLDNVKGNDTAARYGGEEFAVLLEGADLQVGLTVGRQICERISKQRLVKRGTGEPVGHITLSIGVAQYRPSENGSSFVERADSALYEAKRTGRSRVCAAV